MALMYGPSGIRTNAVAPGVVLTNIEARYDSKLGEERFNSVLATIPDAVNGDALAASITFLLSDDDGLNLNGVVLPSDGGWPVQQHVRTKIQAGGSLQVVHSADHGMEPATIQMTISSGQPGAQRHAESMWRLRRHLS